MFDYFNRIKSIRKKLLIQFGLLITFSMLLMVIMLFTIEKITQFTTLRRNSLQLYNLVYKMRTAEKDFIIQDITDENFFKTGSSNNIKKFIELHQEARKRILAIQNFPSASDHINLDSLKSASAFLDKYASRFHDLSELYKQRGFKDFGLEGTLRQAIHDIEKGNESFDKVLMLTLRRHEKDFLLRLDQQYVVKFDTTLAKFLTSARESGNTDGFIEKVNTYNSAFHLMVDLYKDLGTSIDKGIKGDLKASVEKMDPVIEGLVKSISSNVDSTTNKAYIFLIGLFFLQLGIAVYLAITFSKQTTEGVREINNRITTLSEGQFPEKIIPQTEDEIGTTSHALNNLIDRIRVASDFANKIGSGELNTTYDSNFSNDVLATSLQNMHGKLKEADLENKRRNWTTAGLAKFAELVRQSDKDLESMAQKLISNLVKYLNANQGQIYVVENDADDKEILRLAATYAWNRTKYIKKLIEKGDGLVGQAWIEAEKIYITEVPSDYIIISSGTGEASPNNILIVPMKVNDEIFGILEIASFNILETYQVEFVEKLGEVIASALSTHKINARTKILLLESQQQAEELRAQEEAVRQNQEEMMANQEMLMASQEEMQTNKKELEEKIEWLENQLLLARSGAIENQN